MKKLNWGAGALGLAPSSLTGTGLFQTGFRTGSVEAHFHLVSRKTADEQKHRTPAKRLKGQ